MKTKQVVESFSDFGLCVISDFRAEGRYSTAHTYQYALASYARYLGKEQIEFSDLTRPLLKGFEDYLCVLQRKWNTISNYLRALCALYNRAVDAGLTKGVYRLFSGLYTGVDNLKKHALEPVEIRALMDEERVKDQDFQVRRAQDLLRLSLMLGGIPFVDLTHLRRGDLKDGVLSWHRKKTRTALSVTLLPEAAKLIERYRSVGDLSPYLLDLLHGCSGGEADHREYTSLLRRFNYDLCKLARCCGVASHVSSYTARYTWAMVAKQCGVPIAVISQMLGHTSVRTTEIYLRGFDKSCTDKANNLTNLYIETGKIMPMKFG